MAEKKEVAKAVKHTVLSEDELINRLEAWFRDCPDPFPLTVTGHSMVPFAAPGRDTVFLYPCSGKVKKGDVILFRSSSGRLFLHRVIKTGSGIITAGDEHSYPDAGYADKIYAQCRKVKRKNKVYNEKSFFWFFFSKIWVHTMPFRKILLRLRRKK